MAKMNDTADLRAKLKVAGKLVGMLKEARKCIAHCRQHHPDPQAGTGFPIELFIDAVLAEALAAGIVEL